MSNQELCTQYEFIVKMLKNGNTDDVIEILEDAIDRIKGQAAGKKSKGSGEE